MYKTLEFYLIYWYGNLYLKSIVWKCTVSAEFWANRPKLNEHCAFPQNVLTRK